MRLLNRLVPAIATAALLLAAAQPAHALPSYARQTGESCAACHIGAFGPQLTPHGIKFKLNGYSETDGKEHFPPLSGMVVGSWTHTAKGQPGGAGPHDGANNNFSLQEASAFLAGRLADHLGSFVQATWSDSDTRKFTLDNVDVRYARNFELGGRDTIAGLSFNNSPTLSDPFNTLAAWRFPYMASELAPSPAASPVLDGALAATVGGLNAYSLWGPLYLEIGGYQTLSNGFLRTVNVLGNSDAADRISGTAPYARLGFFRDNHKSAWHAGLVAFAPKVRPGGLAGPTDDYRDVGIDGSWQYLGNRRDIFALNGAWVREKRTLNATCAGGACDSLSGTLSRLDLNSSYFHDNTWGLTAGLFDIRGSRDTGLYASGSPNSDGYTLQADWTPWGKDDSWNAPWANLRLGLQYTGYLKFDGARTNYDGTGRNARDNNTVFLFAWTSF